ncbi:NAD-dependent epimerase/dehydratase family protein, partial [Candidatus Parcubacteria bacterium]|nr:NAD-dependent epimerase/dehydratase family protein [Candidatus Parcubacteria bacterium]
ERRSGKPLTIVGDGKQTRDFVNIKDVVRANISAMVNASVGKGESINIASGRSVPINEIASIIGGPADHLPPRLEIKDSLADITLARKLLNWQPMVGLEDGLKELLK